MITKSESESITIIRVLAMLLILICHYVSWFPRIAFSGQFFNVGVSLFFIISGYLYGQKKIGNVTLWLRKRFITLSVPIYTYYCVGTIALIILGRFGTPNLLEIVLQALHLQGLLGGGIGNLQTGHLWFVSFIFLCYLITPTLQQLNLSRKLFILIVVLACIIEIAIILCFGTHAFISWTPGVFCYVISYYIARDWNRKISSKVLVVLLVLVILSICLRIGLKMLIDGTRLYDYVITQYTHCIIAFGIFFSVYSVLSKNRLFCERLYKCSKVIAPISFEIYIVHYCMIKGTLALEQLTSSWIVNTIILISGIILFSVSLNKVSKLIISRMLDKKL